VHTQTQLESLVGYEITLDELGHACQVYDTVDVREEKILTVDISSLSSTRAGKNPCDLNQKGTYNREE